MVYFIFNKIYGLFERLFGRLLKRLTFQECGVKKIVHNVPTYHINLLLLKEIIVIDNSFNQSQ